MLGRVGLAILPDLDFIGSAIFATKHALRSETAMVHDEACPCLAAQEFDFIIETETSAVTTVAA